MPARPERIVTIPPDLSIHIHDVIVERYGMSVRDRPWIRLLDLPVTP